VRIPNAYSCPKSAFKLFFRNLVSRGVAIKRAAVLFNKRNYVGVAKYAYVI